MRVSCKITHESNGALIIMPTSNAEFLRQLRLTYQYSHAVIEDCVAEWFNRYVSLAKAI
jgi:hypothetical protein